VTLGSAFGMWHLSQLSQRLVHQTALEGAAQQSETFAKMNTFYATEIVDRAKPQVETSTAYRTTHGTIPPPATMTIDFGDYLTAHSDRGTRLRLYSDLPFKNRTDGGVRDDFERQALDHLRERPGEPYYRFEDDGGKMMLRYATASVMQEACVNCHNNHPDSPKKDWQVGDVRGVLEIMRPLDKDEEQTRTGLQGTFIVVGAVAGGLLSLSLLILVVGRWRRGSAQPGKASNHSLS
jgi:adenylate cyclase